jgi:hypothetical protein
VRRRTFITLMSHDRLLYQPDVAGPLSPRWRCPVTCNAASSDHPKAAACSDLAAAHGLFHAGRVVRQMRQDLPALVAVKTQAKPR